MVATGQMKLMLGRQPLKAVHPTRLTVLAPSSAHSRTVLQIFNEKLIELLYIRITPSEEPVNSKLHN
jgi:hypothetical protein